MTLEALQAKREKLLEIVGTGALEHAMADGSRTVFQSGEHLRAAIREIDREIAASQQQEPRLFVVKTSRGL